MTQATKSAARAWTAFLLTAILLAPTFGVFINAANAQGYPPAPVKKGMSTRTKVLLLGGAALLYYLYRKHQASVAAKANAPAVGNTAAAQMPQLYRSRNGGVYYRDAQHRPVWLTVPNQAVQVPAYQVQQYAPDYRRYNGPAPAAPSGYRTQSFDDFEPDPAFAQ